jgi:dUTP pyrophosphatase
MNDDSPDDLTARRRKRERATTTPEPCGLCEGAGTVDIDCPECTDDSWVQVEVDAPPVVRVKLSRPDARLPAYQTDGASGADLHAAIDQEFWLHVGEKRVVDTGVCLELPEGLEGQVRGRSGLARKHGVYVLQTGTIDSDYRGVIGVQLHNLGDRAFHVQPGDRIAQLIIAPVVRATFEVVNELGDTDRGAGGFGSTGVR